MKKIGSFNHLRITQTNFIPYIKEVNNDLNGSITSTQNTNNTMLQSAKQKNEKSIYHVNSLNKKIQSDTELTNFIQNTKNNEYLIKETIEQISLNFERLISSDNIINEEIKKTYQEKKDNILNYINKNNIEKLISLNENNIEKLISLNENNIEKLISLNENTEIAKYSENLKNIKESFIEIIQEYLSPNFKQTPTTSLRIDKHLALINKTSHYTQ
ncbi:hypothetical protein [Proteus sp. PR00208]|uniref:hypothetical protein n=1 Tax=Proteus sp. PR00208 TaxID=2794025 RepID=UPI0018E44521|nr:hypothetical protein [Proteus sp. PR00208]MBI6406330.1 hypothetical protein [Proteus sp. PR00208]